MEQEQEQSYADPNIDNQQQMVQTNELPPAAALSESEDDLSNIVPSIASEVKEKKCEQGPKPLMEATKSDPGDHLTLTSVVANEVETYLPIDSRVTEDSRDMDDVSTRLSPPRNHDGFSTEILQNSPSVEVGAPTTSEHAPVIEHLIETINNSNYDMREVEDVSKAKKAEVTASISDSHIEHILPEHQTNGINGFSENETLSERDTEFALMPSVHPVPLFEEDSSKNLIELLVGAEAAITAPFVLNDVLSTNDTISGNQSNMVEKPSKPPRILLEEDSSKSVLELLVGSEVARSFSDAISERAAQSASPLTQAFPGPHNQEDRIREDEAKLGDTPFDNHISETVLFFGEKPFKSEISARETEKELIDSLKGKSDNFMTPPQEVAIPILARAGSTSPTSGPLSTVSNGSCSARGSPSPLPTLPTINSTTVLTNSDQYPYKDSGTASHENNSRNERNSPAEDIRIMTPRRSAAFVNAPIDTRPRVTDSPVVYHDVASSVPSPYLSRPSYSRQDSRAQENPVESSASHATYDPATAMDVLTQHLLQSLEGKFVAQQQQQHVQQQQQQYTMQHLPSSLSGYSTPIGARGFLPPAAGPPIGANGAPVGYSTAMTSIGAPYVTQPQPIYPNANHVSMYNAPLQHIQPASVGSETKSVHNGSSVGKKSIKLELKEQRRPDLKNHRKSKSYAASAVDLFTHKREGSLFGSISRFRSKGSRIDASPSNEPEVIAANLLENLGGAHIDVYKNWGTITVCWYDGTTTSELQTHVRNSITRKIGREVEDIRLLEETNGEYVEVVLTPHVPNGSKFIVRFLEPVPPAPVRTVYKYGERAPDSPSAAPSPSPSSLELSNLPLLDSSATKSMRDATLVRRSGNGSTDRVIGDVTSPRSGSGLKGSLGDALSTPTPKTIHEEPTENVVIVQASVSQEKKHVIFVIANYFVLFLSFIAVMAELHERAPGWINDQYSQVQACAVDRDTLFECVSNGDFRGLIASFFLWVSKSKSFKRFFLFGFSTRQQLWIVIYESFVTSFCWGFSYIFIRRGLNPDTRRNFLSKYWKDAVYGALAGFNASFMKAVLKNLIPREAVEEVFVETQQLGLINILGRMFRPHQPVSVASISADLH